MGIFLYRSVDEDIALLCRREELKFGTCLINRLKCYYKKDCGREYMLMKLICSVLMKRVKGI